jgi:hypothetical protein
MAALTDKEINYLNGRDPHTLHDDYLKTPINNFTHSSPSEGRGVRDEGRGTGSQFLINDFRTLPTDPLPSPLSRPSPLIPRPSDSSRTPLAGELDG